MEKYQKEIQLEQLNHENNIRAALAANYKAALKEIKKQILDISNAPDFNAEKVMQIKYQLMLEAQLETILYKLGESNVSDMTNYLETVYQEAYLGCLYGMHKDGVDLILQVDENKVERVIHKRTQDLKFSERIYKNVDQLKEETKRELSRGLSTSRDYLSIARQIAIRTGINLRRAYTIARTEGGRVQSEADMDCMHDAVAAGADVVKEWVSTLDNVTRNTHRELDGQVRELDEEFVIPSSGARAMYPCGFGIAREDINCRCCLNQRARWNLESKRYKYSKEAGGVINLNSDIYREWKQRYNKTVDIMFADAAGRKASDTIDVKVKLLKLLHTLPTKAQQALIDVKYEFGGSGSYYDILNHVIRYADNPSKKEILHEMGHALENKLFSAVEVKELKKKYVAGLTVLDIAKKTYKTSGGKEKDIVLLLNDRFIEEYQGRIYVKRQMDAVDSKGNIKLECLEEFLSVPIASYLGSPEELKREDKTMYDFIERKLK